MKIAILGWGSLIWNPENLAYNKVEGWSPEGPFLPIEFARISSENRLTLVITDDVKEKLVKTLYAISTSKTIFDASQNLASREKTNIINIGSYYKLINRFTPTNFKYKDEILSWMKKNETIDGVIWTNLEENWKDKLKYKGLDRIKYLASLGNEANLNAKEYIKKAPKQIDTELRREIQEKLNWK